MKKTILFLLMLITLLSMTFAPAALAATIVHSGSYSYQGGSFDYTVDSEGALKITGTGYLDSYSFNTSMLPDMGSYSNIPYTSIEVSDGVTTIGAGAFGWNHALKDVVLGKDVTKIESMAFYACGDLTSITLPAGLTTIGTEAFDASENLSDVYFGGTMAQWKAISIGNYNDPLHNATIHCKDGEISYDLDYSIDSDGVFTFTGTGHMTVRFTSEQMITKVVINDGLLSIPSDCFEYCYNLKSFEVDENNPAFCAVDGVLYSKDKTRLHSYPNGKEGAYSLLSTVKTIADYAFSGSDCLTAITLNEGLEEIGMGAFFNCYSLETIAIPASVDEIGFDAFTGCDNLIAINVDSDNGYYYSIDGVVFDGNDDTLWFFPNGKGGKYIVPEGTTDIGGSAFYRSEELTEVVLPEGLDCIYTDAFGYCSNLEKIHLPLSLTRIVESAFENCDKLADIYYAGTKAQWDDIEIEDNNAALSWATIHCSDGNIENDEITGSIGEGIEYTLTKDGKLTVSGSGEWDYWAFGDSTLIVEAVLESGVSEVGHGGFDWCVNLEKITIPRSVDLIKYSAFYNCEALTDVYYAGTMAEWEALMEASASYDDFYYDISDNEGLGWATIHCSDGDIAPLYDNPNEGGENGDNPTPLRYYGLPADLVEIKAEAFMSSPVEFVSIPYGCTTIGSAAFKNCSDLIYIFVPSSVTSIADDAFDGCNADLTFILTGSGPAMEYAGKHGFYVEIISEE